MKTFAHLSVVLAGALLTGCGASKSSTPMAALPPAATKVEIHSGDKITVQLTGVPDGGFFIEKQIPASGDISLPYITQSFHTAGRSPAEMAAEITDAYKSQKIYTNPIVNVLPEQQFINVGGDVRGPSNVLWRADSTLMSTINSCGGFSDYANRRSVRILRGQQVIVVDCIKAIQTPGADPPVYPGDQIYVPRTPF